MANRVRSRLGLGLGILSLGVSALAACSAKDNAAPDGGGTTPTDDAGVDGGNGGLVTDSGQTAAKSLTIDPPTADLVVSDLTALPSLPLAAKVLLDDGSVVQAAASWTVDRLDIASIGAGSGTLTAAGSAYGKVTVTAKALGVSGTATVTVHLRAAIDDQKLAQADRAALDAASASDPAVTRFAYPYDQTVFPRGLLPAELMWNGGADGDEYRIRVQAPNFDLSVYTTADALSRYTMPTALWNALTTSAAGATAAVELRRYAGGAAYVSAHQTWNIADANLRGSIYYWAVDVGQIVKLDLTSGARSAVFDAGPASDLGTPVPLNATTPRTPPWEDATADHKRCVACHAVSKDGTTIAAVFSRDESIGPFGYVDTQRAQVKAIGDYELNGSFATLTPDGTLSAINLSAKMIRLVDTATGNLVPSIFDDKTNLCDPAFAPSGKAFAVATNCDPNSPDSYPVEYATSDLSIFDFDQGSRVFSGQKTLLTSTGMGDAIAFPSFSPDSKSVFYQRGDFSRAKYGTNQHGNDDLYVVRTDGTPSQIALDNANGKGVLTGDNLHLNYAPTVNPIAEGGYTWIVFTSARDYGNRMVSPGAAPPNDATYSNHKQLWVAAVDASGSVGDPSHPAFWLPGQDAESINMFGYWALAPCKPTDAGGATQSCSAGFECCSGFCRDNGSGPVCVDQAGGCHQLGEKCSADGDCCGVGTAVTCAAGVCQKAAPR